MVTTRAELNIRYEPDERPPNALALGLGFQFAMLTISGIVLTPMIVVRAAGGSDAFLSWAVFAAVLISGVTTALQAVRVGRIGAGYILLMGTSGAFIAVSVTALAEGGPGMLGTLILISALFQFLLSARLSLFRRIITPAVAGTVIMLIAVTIMPIVFDLLADVPTGTARAAAPASAVATLLATLGVLMLATGVWRLWAPVIGLVTGCLIAAAFGLYDMERVFAAAWIGLPEGWPGLDFSFDRTFWTLLPGFIFVTLVGAIETVGDAVAIQEVSWRRNRATDYRAVQGAVTADGVGNLLSGLACTLPNTTYSSSVSITQVTGVAARRVGVCIGAVFVVLAFLPKTTALLLAIPSPVIGANSIVFLSLLFVLGMRIVLRDGLDYRRAAVVGVAFWIGVGFQNGSIFADYLGEWWGGLLGNGMTAGGLAALLMTGFMELTSGRRRRIQMDLDMESLPRIQKFLTRLASDRGWGTAMTDRLCLTAEETLLTLVEHETEADTKPRRTLVLIVRTDADGAELDFLAASGEANIEDRMAFLGDRPSENPVQHEISLRLLRHFASSVRHQQYEDADIVTIRIEAKQGKPAQANQEPAA